MEIRALRESDDRSVFRSGDSDLDRFLQKYAGQNQFRHHIGTTYVAVETDRIIGNATVAPAHVEVRDLPVSLRKKLPRYPLPVLLLACLAVDQSVQGQGVGQALLRLVFRLASRMAADVGCLGVVVDAKADAIEFYRRLGFVPLAVLEGHSEARPQPLAMFLPVGDIEAARG